MYNFNWRIKCYISFPCLFVEFLELPPAFANRIVKLTEGNPHELYLIHKEELGRGKYGTVYLCEDKETKLKLAAKFVECTKKEDKRDMEREIEIMNALRHPRLIQIYDALEYNKNICVILEL